jgi:predicted MFS family arabinose efflux permease
VALPGLAIALLFFFVKDYKTVGLEQTVRDREGAAPSEPMKSKMTKMDIARAFARTPSLLLTYFGFAGMMFLSISLSSFLPTYFHRVQGVSLQTATLMTSGIMLMAIPGSPLGGWIADRWMKKKVQARLLVPSISAAATAVLYFSAIHFFSGGAFQYALFLVASIASIAWASSAIAVTQDVVHPGLRAISYALCVIVQNLLGSSLGPLVTGSFSDAYGIATALKIASVIAVLSCILFYLGSRFYVGDLAKVERVALTPEK